MVLGRSPPAISPALSPGRPSEEAPARQEWTARPRAAIPKDGGWSGGGTASDEGHGGAPRAVGGTCPQHCSHTAASSVGRYEWGIGVATKYMVMIGHKRWCLVMKHGYHSTVNVTYESFFKEPCLINPQTPDKLTICPARQTRYSTLIDQISCQKISR